MDVRYINPVLESLLNILSTMAELRPSVGKPTLKADQVALGEVTGLMHMESPQVRASLAISFSEAVIIDLVRRMLREEIDGIDDTARDMTGEITNMVVGGAKNLYAQQGFDFAMSTPRILSGARHRVEHEFDGRVILLPLKSDAGEFYVELCFENV